MKREDPSRREFLLKVARGAAYSAPLVATFAVAPDLLAQAPSLPGGHHMTAPAPSSPAPSEAPGPRPTDKHPPPSKKGG
ncbi:MAG: hypothetical protein GWN99_09700 [Gemmatimonadetes bacterium]|uniref:Uncharacterized protein n=1 Tax=Candidatus Kutchimonas denitrificans TaxID=3056748 RepID=A0AAE4Z9T0_9BACT|nr:hypothetical protein [Gemmatimonadota bacterium]NIR74141.1 hypothetical protein [Candidatus Kutchimonas denitrificans]NIS01323.1 hypothetical protein [Gemmatimonadota bacterium]NIT67054.1 hypothetical protein [Gemmatimonadota bacterium]NIU51714.1 hypothetical protein [Gemmatimonadota bacterium]